MVQGTERRWVTQTDVRGCKLYESMLLSEPWRTLLVLQLSWVTLENGVTLAEVVMARSKCHCDDCIWLVQGSSSLSVNAGFSISLLSYSNTDYNCTLSLAVLRASCTAWVVTVRTFSHCTHIPKYCFIKKIKSFLFETRQYLLLV